MTGYIFKKIVAFRPMLRYMDIRLLCKISQQQQQLQSYIRLAPPSSPNGLAGIIHNSLKYLSNPVDKKSLQCLGQQHREWISHHPPRLGLAQIWSNIWLWSWLAKVISPFHLYLNQIPDRQINPRYEGLQLFHDMKACIRCTLLSNCFMMW